MCNFGLRFIVVFMIVTAVSKSHADNHGMPEGKTFAGTTGVTIYNSITTTIDESNAEFYNGSDVPAVGYYGSGVSIEEEARAESLENETVQFLSSSRPIRDSITIDQQTDPLFQNYEAISDSATDLTDTYTGCVDLPAGDLVSSIDEPEQVQSCRVSRTRFDEDITCTRRVVAQCTNDQVYNLPDVREVYLQLLGEGVPYYTMSVEVNYATGQYRTIIDPLSTVSIASNMLVNITPMDISEICADNVSTIEYNAMLPLESLSTMTTTPESLSSNGSVQQHPTCENGLIGIYTINATDLSSTGLVSVGRLIKYTVTVTDDCPIELVDASTCDLPAGSEDPTLISTTCIDDEDKYINGVLTTRDCWVWEDLFRVERVMVDETDGCESLRDLGCGYTGVECLALDDLGLCLEETHFYTCGGNTTDETVALCGSTLICPDGDCADGIATGNEGAEDDFLVAAATAAAAEELSSELGASASDLSFDTIFNGTNKRCQRANLGFSDCCSDSGWGLDSGLSVCSTEEVELGYAKAAGTTIYVGSYRSGGLFDRKRNHVYCVYTSKIGRVIMQQGNEQLGIGYGTARSPICDGITLEQFQTLDMSTMDFSALFGDIADSANEAERPTSQYLAELIQEKLEEMSR